MNDQQTATTILALEECIEQYIADCRGRVDSFVEGHFSLRETVARQKQSLMSDLLCYPINALWAIPSLFAKKLLEVPAKLGWHTAEHLIGLMPGGLKTRYQKENERLIAIELLQWPSKMDDQRASQDRLVDCMKHHKQLAPLLASGALSVETLRQRSNIPRLIAEHSSSRALVLDTTATVLTLVAGWLLFGDHSLGIAGIGDQLAKKRAHDKAASTFILGATLGSAFYSLFPPKPSFGQVISATLAVALFITTMSLLVCLLSDPCLKRMGFQHARLHKLIDAVEESLHRQLRTQFKPLLRKLAA